MTILGLSGKKGAGKDTVADIIIAYLKERNLPIQTFKINFADSLYEEVAVALWPAIAFNAAAIAARVSFIKDHKDNFRLILQGWGTDYRRKMFGEDYWIRKWQHRVNSEGMMKGVTRLLLCCDCRFLNELEALQGNGAYVWRIQRTVVNDTHQSETELDKVDKWDEVVTNDGTLEELKTKVLELAKSIK